MTATHERSLPYWRERDIVQLAGMSRDTSGRACRAHSYAMDVVQDLVRVVLIVLVLVFAHGWE
jgi:hypothetical protein